jgi:SAM-dependent methyltransferase
MKNIQNWKPTKYIFKGSKLIASRDKNEVSIASRLIADRVASFYQQTIPNHVTGRLLDLGCGKVPLYGVYKDMVTDIVCVDWDNSPHGSEFLDEACDLSQELPFENDSFDTVILSDVLEHLPDPYLLLREVARILRNNGKLLVSVPFMYNLHECPYDYYRYTEHAVKFLTERSNLTLIESRVLGGPIDVLSDLAAKVLIRIPHVGVLFAVIIQKVANIVYIKRLFRSENLDRRFPLEYGFIIGKI